jgi:hypothetical protein
MLAHLVLWGSVLRIGVCLFIILSPTGIDAKEEAVRRYVGGGGLETLWSRISAASMTLVIAVSVGVLCEISGRRRQS